MCMVVDITTSRSLAGDCYAFCRTFNLFQASGRTSNPSAKTTRAQAECPLWANSRHWSAIARTQICHCESKRSEKGHGENRRKNVCCCYGHVPNWLTDPNERHKKRHNCERKANNYDGAENSVHVLARYELACHRLNPSGLLVDLFRKRAFHTQFYHMRAVKASKKLLPSPTSRSRSEATPTGQCAATGGAKWPHFKSMLPCSPENP